MSVRSGDGGEKGRGVERAGVEEVGRFCRMRNISNGIHRYEGRRKYQDWGGWRERTSAGFEGVGTEGEDVGGEARLQESSLVSRYGRDRGGRHCHEPMDSLIESSSKPQDISQGAMVVRSR